MSRRWSVNITPAERAARVLVGLVGAVGGVWLLADTPPTVAVVLEALLVLAEIDLVLRRTP